MIYDVNESLIDFLEFNEDELLYLIQNFTFLRKKYRRYLSEKDFVCYYHKIVDFSKMSSFKNLLTEIQIEYVEYYQGMMFLHPDIEDVFTWLTDDFIQWRKLNAL